MGEDMQQAYLVALLQPMPLGNTTCTSKTYGIIRRMDKMRGTV